MSFFFEEMLGTGRVDVSAANCEERFRLVGAWAALNDVTRLAECTGFDRLDVPNFYAVRPSALHPCAIVSSGKGLTRASAILSALFECYERWAAEQSMGGSYVLSATELSLQFPDCVLSAPSSIEQDEERPWVVGFDLISQKPCFLPLKKVLFPYPSWLPADPVLTSNTSGLAAGTDPFETLSSAVLEVIERDAVSRLDESNLECVDLWSAGGPARSLADTFRSNGILLSIVRCPSPFGIPTFYCLSRDDQLAVNSLFCSGSAAHPNQDEALTKTLLEVTQSRIAYISTLRDDVGPQIERQLTVDYDKRAATFAQWFSSGPLCPLHGSLQVCSVTPRELMNDLLSRLRMVRPDMVLGCARLRESDGLVAFRVYSADLNELIKA